MATSVRYIFHGDLHKEVLPIAQYLFCFTLVDLYITFTYIYFQI